MNDFTPEMLLTVLDSPIAYHRIYATITGSVTAAVMLSQAMYWTPRTKDSERWFYKTADEWQKETGLSRREQETARRTLKSLSILEEKKQGLPCQLFFRLNLKTLYEHIVESAKQDTPKEGNKYGGKRQTGKSKSAKLDETKTPNILYTEITPEITSKNTTEKILEQPLSFFPSGRKEESEVQANISSHAQNSDPNIQDPQTPKPLSPASPENFSKPIHRRDRPASQKIQREEFVAPLLEDHDFLRYLFKEMKRLKTYFAAFSDTDYEPHAKLFVEIACEPTTKGDRRFREIQDFAAAYDRHKAEQARIEEERRELERQREREVDDGPRMSPEELKAMIEGLKQKAKLNKLTA